MTSQQPEWPVAFFDDDYLEIYRPMFTPEGTGREIDFIEAALGLPREAAVLDLGCGYGRHAVGLARRGWRMTGVDFNARYLALAAEAATAAAAQVRWVQGDMRTLGFERAFDGVYSFFTSFGYFSDEENERVIENVARALVPGGVFLLDTAHRDWLLAHPPQRMWNQRADGSFLMEEATLDLRASRVVSRQVLLAPEGGVKSTKEYTLRVYTCAELTALLRRHGLVVREVWGGTDRSAYSVESRRLVLLAGRSDG